MYDQQFAFQIDGGNFTNDELMNRIDCAFNNTANSRKKKNIFTRQHDTNVTYISMEEAYLRLGKEKICKIWHSLKQNAEKFGYTQLFYEEYRCEDEELWHEIVDVDNINSPNMTRYHLYKQKEDREKQKSKQNKLKHQKISN